MDLRGIIRDVALQSQLKTDLDCINKFELPTAMDVFQQQRLAPDPLIFPHPLAAHLLTSSLAKGSSWKNFCTQSSKLRPKQLKTDQM